MRWLMPLALLGSLAACGDKDDDSGSSSSTTDSGSTDTTDVPDPETACDDGVDNDSDGATDCDDSDCADAFECSYPDAIAHTTVVEFDGYQVECDLGIWGTHDEQIDDCVTRFTVPLTEATTGDLCPACDRTYSGPITYEQDSCLALIGGDRPTEGWFGFVFIDENTRELWSRDEIGGGWVKGVTLSRKGGEWRLVESGEVAEDVETDFGDCENNPLTLGLLTVTMTFVDQ